MIKGYKFEQLFFYIPEYIPHSIYINKYGIIVLVMHVYLYVKWLNAKRGTITADKKAEKRLSIKRKLRNSNWNKVDFFLTF